MRRELVVAERYGPSTLTFDGNLVVSIGRFSDPYGHRVTGTYSDEDVFRYEADTGYPEGSAEIRNSTDRLDVETTERADPESPTGVATRTVQTGSDAEGNLIWREVEDYDGTRTFEVYRTTFYGTPNLTRSTTVDPNQAHDWALKDFIYQNGPLSQSRVVQDNGLYEAIEYRHDGVTPYATFTIDFGEQ
jgi:hypothetical protein